jgi:hypothetical protein
MGREKNANPLMHTRNKPVYKIPPRTSSAGEKILPYIFDLVRSDKTPIDVTCCHTYQYIPYRYIRHLAVVGSKEFLDKLYNHLSAFKEIFCTMNSVLNDSTCKTMFFPENKTMKLEKNSWI